jgi:broad specificity phosphatase PhoE
MTDFFLIRHGETDWTLNEKYELKGASRDLPCLTKNGVREAKEISKDARLEKAEIIISSPYTRALQTAAIISKNINLDIIVEFDLREWQPDLNFGIENLHDLKNAVEDYQENDGIYPVGASKKWESKELLSKRANNVLKKYFDYSYVVVVTHEQLIKTWIDAVEIDRCFINELNMV